MNEEDIRLANDSPSLPLLTRESGQSGLMIYTSQRDAALLLGREPLPSAGRTTVVPVHSGEVIGPGLLTSILRQIQITRDELFEQL